MSKASKLRPCPALSRDISAADCGEQRESRLSCPDDCPYNPFGGANYSQLLEIEDRLDRKTMARLTASTPDLSSLARELENAERRGIDAIHAFYAKTLFFATDADQTTFAQRWERAGLRELKNDERVLLRAKMRMQIALLEIHRVFADGRIEAVDLLSPAPEPMVFLDRSLAGMAVRFTTLLSWIFPLPHFWRLSGSAIHISDVAQMPAAEIVREIAGHLGGPVIEPEMRRWLAEHFVKFSAANAAVAQSRRRQMLAGMDAKFGKTVYDLRAPFAECRKCLDTMPAVAPDDLSEEEEGEGMAEARAWFDRAPELERLAPPGAQPVLGRILLGQSHWRLEAFGAEKSSRLRRQFEELLGDRVCFSSERVDDLGAQLSARRPAVDDSLVPPSLLENPEKLLMTSSRVPSLPPGMSQADARNYFMRANERAFLEDKIPALSNLTPREAASDPALRPKLIQLMKQRVRSHDESNLETGRTDDINWLLRELNLEEIMFDAPPWRPPAAPPDGGDAALPELLDDDRYSGVDPTRPPAPLLPDAPFELEEVMERLQGALDLFQTHAEAEEELSASGSTLLDDAGQLTIDFLSEEEYWFAIPFLLRAWFSLVPPGCRSPEITFDDLERAFDSALRQIESSRRAGTPNALESFLQSGPQPCLTMVLLSEYLDATRTAPKKFRPTQAALPVTMALLKSVVELLDEVLRPK